MSECANFSPYNWSTLSIIWKVLYILEIFVLEFSSQNFLRNTSLRGIAIEHPIYRGERCRAPPQLRFETACLSRARTDVGCQSSGGVRCEWTCDASRAICSVPRSAGKPAARERISRTRRIFDCDSPTGPSSGEQWIIRKTDTFRASILRLSLPVERSLFRPVRQSEYRRVCESESRCGFSFPEFPPRTVGRWLVYFRLCDHCKHSSISLKKLEKHESTLITCLLDKSRFSRCRLGEKLHLFLYYYYYYRGFIFFRGSRGEREKETLYLINSPPALCWFGKRD